MTPTVRPESLQAENRAWVENCEDSRVHSITFPQLGTQPASDSQRRVALLQVDRDRVTSGSPHGAGTSERFLADLTGDGPDDMVLFDVSQGDWNVSTSDGNGFAATPSPWVHGHGAGS
jgi:hypothetical protein